MRLKAILLRGGPGSIAAILATSLLSAGLPQPTIAQSNTGVVQIHVESSDGRPIPELTAADFELVIGGQPQRIARVIPPGPLTVLFLGDVSKSVVDRTRTRVATWIDPISSAAEHFVRALQAGDRARLMAVAGSAFEAGATWTTDRQTLEAAARRLVPTGAPKQGSPIWDAVDLALPFFANEPGRRAIVLVTDGRASGNSSHVEDVAKRAAEVGVAVSIVELEATPRTLEMIGTPAVPSPAPFLRMLAAATGGTYLMARVNPEMLVHAPGPLVATALRQQRSSYLLQLDSGVGARPTGPVDVRVRRPGLAARVTVQPDSAEGQPSARGEAMQVFRAEANLVEVIVRVTDTQGRFVPDLTRNDFELRDSRQRQTIVAFNTVNLPRQRPQPVGSTGQVVTSASAPGMPTSALTVQDRLFVILLDDMMTSSDFVLPVRRVARQFIEDHVDSADRVAVFSTAGFGAIGQDLTTDKTKVLDAIDRFQGRAGPCGETPRAGSREKESDAEYVYRIRSATDVMGKLAGRLSGIRGRRISLLWVSEGIGYDVTRQGPAGAVGVSGFSAESAGTDVGSVVQAMRNAIDALRRANVTLYAVDPRHLWAVDWTGGAHACEDSRRSVDVLRNFSALTGGFAAVDSNDYRTAFDRIVDEGSQYYVLGFQPSVAGRPGDLRPLDVRVTSRPGVRVTARPGYVVPVPTAELPIPPAAGGPD
jgi:VWFA-related protein